MSNYHIEIKSRMIVCNNLQYMMPDWRTSSKMHEWQLKMLFGLRPVDKWPSEGMEEIYIGNVRVWVRSKERAKENKQFHRALCFCPECGKQMSAGRLHQHMKVHKD